MKDYQVSSKTGNFADYKILSLRKILYKILLAVNGVFAIALLLSYLAVVISPVDFVWLAFLGLAYPYLLVFNIVFVIVWAMLLRFEAFISLAIIVIGFNHFSNYIKLTRPSGDKTNTFKVVSYNVRLFNYFENNRGLTSEKKILSFLKSQSPDIICLQDLFLVGKPSVEESMMVDYLGGKYYSHMKVTESGKNRYYGIVTFSKYPIIKRGEVIHPSSSSLTIYTDIVINKDTIRIYNNHLESFRLKRMERSFIEELSASDKKTMKEVKSLSVSLKKGFEKRAIQAQVVKDFINKSPYKVMVAGDFNDTPVSYVYRKIRKGLNDSFINSGYGAGFTYRGNYPPNRIDYILYDNKYINSYFEIIKMKYSDHYPIVAYFKKKS
jgi:endonuclease/exonuclease/phosphatase family metal-dependent hydrolase